MTVLCERPQLFEDYKIAGERAEVDKTDVLSGILVTSDRGPTYELNTGSRRFQTLLMRIKSLRFIAKRLLLSEQGPVSLDDEC